MGLDFFKLWLFWEKYSVENKLTTTGMRKLALLCFSFEEAEELMRRISNYSGKPAYPFWDQPQIIREVVAAMLRTHPMGKDLVREAYLRMRSVKKLTNLEKPETREESEFMGKIIIEVAEFLKELNP